MSFIGAKMNIDPHIYKVLLGICLSFAVFRLFLKNVSLKESRNLAFIWAHTYRCIYRILFRNDRNRRWNNPEPVSDPVWLGKLKGNCCSFGNVHIIKFCFGTCRTLKFRNPNLILEIYSWILTGLIGAIFGSYMGSFKFGFQKLQIYSCICFAFCHCKTIYFLKLHIFNAISDLFRLTANSISLNNSIFLFYTIPILLF